MSSILSSASSSIKSDGDQSGNEHSNSGDQSISLRSSVYRDIDSDLGRFFTTHREREANGKNVYCIMLESSDNLNLMRLGVHYRLHPLVLEDLISSEGMTKLDNYDTHLMLTVPLAFLKSRRFNTADDKEKDAAASEKDAATSSPSNLTTVKTGGTTVIANTQRYVFVIMTV